MSSHTLRLAAIVSAVLWEEFCEVWPDARDVSDFSVLERHSAWIEMGGVLMVCQKLSIMPDGLRDRTDDEIADLMRSMSLFCASEDPIAVEVSGVLASAFMSYATYTADESKPEEVFSVQLHPDWYGVWAAIWGLQTWGHLTSKGWGEER